MQCTLYERQLSTLLTVADGSTLKLAT